MPPFPKKYSTPSQVAVRVVLLRSCLSALYIHIKNVWVRTLMIDTPPTTSHAPPNPPAFSSLAVATCNQADSRGSLISVDSNPSNSDRNSEKMDGCEKVRKEKSKETPSVPSHMLFIHLFINFFGIASLFGWLPCTSHWKILCEIILYMFYIYFLLIFYLFFQTCATCFLSSFIFFYSPCLFSCIKTSTQIPRMCKPSQILTFDSAASRSTKRT